MPVREVTNNKRVEPNRIYVIPPNKGLLIAEGVLKLLPRKKAEGQHRPIDSFFHSLAEDQRERAISVILSGTATDGTLGCEAIKAEGGITFAQDESAKYDSMPRSAIAAGCIDFVLSPEEIAKELARIARHPHVLEDHGEEPIEVAEEQAEARKLTKHPGAKIPGAKEDPFKKILVLLRNSTGVEFSLYKPTTIKRRIARRMVLSKLQPLEAYLRHLKSDQKELEALYQDLLIGVTGFFRNPSAFEVLKKKVFPKLMKERTPDNSVRVWVLGCSTGQEAYSIAMSFLEFAAKTNSNTPLQVFATDINDELLEKARAGLYMKSLVQDVSPERLRRFFVAENGGYRISKTIRDMCIFARQNVLADPPFSQMDLISCRNLLIYLEPALHKKIIPTFHYALRPNGVLFLGVSETVGPNTDLFATIDKKYRIYSKKPTARGLLTLPLSPGYSRPLKPELGVPPVPARESFELDAQRQADRITLSKYAPAGVLINADLEILQFRGATSRYLAPAPGKASFNLLKMAREGLMLPLRAAVNKAKKENQRVRKERVKIDKNGQTTTVNIEVVPLKNLRERCYLILFEPSARASQVRMDDRREDEARSKSAGKITSRESARMDKEQAREVAELKGELAETREYLQTISEEHEAANEELQASNEEVQSANEELQSINEELETSKEELESTNEELITVNEEMQNRNQELNRLNSDLNNLHNSINISVVVLGRDLTIRRFTPLAEKELNLLATDIGQPVNRLKTNLDLLDLEAIITEVIETVSVREREVLDKEGRCYSLRVRPYVTIDNKIDGAVLVLLNITELKQGEQRVRDERNYAQSIIATVREPLLVLDGELRVQTANESFYRTFQTSPAETEGRLIYELSDCQWNIPPLRTLLEDILPKDNFFADYEIAHDFENIGARVMLLSASRLESKECMPERILLAIRDITERRQADVRADSQRQALQLLAEGGLLEDVLEFLVGAVERHSPEDMLAAISPLNEAGTHFQRSIGPSLPDAFNAAIEGVEVSSPSGLCAAAVRRREAVAVPDFNEDAAWQPFAEFVEPYGLRSGWSVPIVSSSGQVLGTFANYYRHAGEPTPQNRELVNMVVRTAAVAIERKRVEEVLQESKAMLDFTLESAQVGDWDLDLIHDTSRRSLRHDQCFGYNEPIPEAEWGFERFIQHVHPDDAERIEREFREATSGLKDWHFECRVVWPDKSVHWIAAHGSILRTPDDKPRRMLGIVMDITERKQVEEERKRLLASEQQAREAAEEANRGKDEFLATVSHELRTPLNAIMGWTHMLMSRKLDEQTTARGLKAIARNAKAQNQLISDLLDVSHIISGQFRFESGVVDLIQVIEAATDTVRPAADAKGVVLQLKMDWTAGMISGDSVRLQQIVWNLLTNAVKFTSRDGHVEVLLKRQDTSVAIIVKDNGEGINPDFLPYIFDRFRQAESTTRRQHGGLGLGLAIVRHLVEAHGGTIHAASQGLGKGATFTVTFPLIAVNRDGSDVDPAHVGSLSVDNASATILKGLRVLVIDDELDARELLTIALTQSGAEVKTAATIRAVLDILNEWKPDVLVSDIGMPGEDGYDLIGTVRALESEKGGAIPAVALTGYATPEDAKRARDAGYQTHMAKPVTPSELVVTVANLAGNDGHLGKSDQ